MSRSLRTVLSGAALLLVASIGLAAPAGALSGPTQNAPAGADTTQASSADSESAAQCPYYLEYDGVNIRALPETNAAIRGQGYKGDCITYHRDITGQNVTCPTGEISDRWVDGTDQRTGVRGWISACYIAFVHP